jgi:S-adenosyl methyltransferase
VPAGSPGLDTSKPNIARVYDYLLGGRDNFDADRQLARELQKLYPPLPRVLGESRAFVSRAVTWAARQDIAQFLDLGAGLPTEPAVHRTARDVLPLAHVVYLDNDPVAFSHASALLATKDGVSAIHGDLTDPAGVLADPALRAAIDPERPLCAIFGMVLHFMDAASAREVVTGYTRLLAPGSVVAVSVVVNDDEVLWKQLQSAYTAGTLYNHSRADIASFLDGLELVPPGIALAHTWRAGMPDPGLVPGGPAYVVAAAARTV